jgi:hypothetical protein
METYQIAYLSMDWGKYSHLKSKLDALDIDCTKWTDENGVEMIEIDAQSQGSLEILHELEIINQYLHNELIHKAQTVFLS